MTKEKKAVADKAEMEVDAPQTVGVAENLGVGTNAAALPWPTDPHGSFVKLRAGGVEAARRVGADQSKLDDLMKVLRIIAAHAKERFVEETKNRAAAQQNAVSAHARIQEKLRRQAEARAEQLDSYAAKVRRDAGIK